VTARTKRYLGYAVGTLAVLVLWEVLSSLAFAYLLPAMSEWGRPYGWMGWFGRFSVPPNPLLGILQYLTPLLHGQALSPTSWLAIRLATCVGALGIVVLYLLWLRFTWAWRLRSRLSTVSEDATLPEIERANTDTLGHARLMDDAMAHDTFPASGGKLIGRLGDGSLIFDECFNTSAVSFEIVGTRAGKTSRAVAMLSFWAIPELRASDIAPNPIVVFDPAEEIGHQMWRMLTGFGRHVYILNPHPAPKDRFGNVFPWQPLIAKTNLIGWLDITHPLAELHVHLVTGLFFEDEDVKKSQSGEFFEGTSESLMACLLAHVLWDTGIRFGRRLLSPPLPRNLASVRDLLSLPADDLRIYLEYIRRHSPSRLARRYAGPFRSSHAETFSDIHHTVDLKTRWLAIDAMAAMVCGNDFAITDIRHDPRMAVFVQIPMDAALNFPTIANVIFGTLLYVKIANMGSTFPLVATDESWMLRSNALRQIALNGSKYRIAMHQLWQSRGDIDRTWSRETRESFFEAAAWIAIGPLGDVSAAKEVSEACGHYAAISHASGDNSSMQYSSSFWGRWSTGSNLSRHPVKRYVFFCHEIMQSLDRNVRLILRLKFPLVVGAAPYFQISELDGWIDDSQYARNRTERVPWYQQVYRLFLRSRQLPVPVNEGSP
jgi:type IV secretion system protein VirD4